MEFSQAISYALDGKAVLFTGAGFSFGAKNEMGDSIADSQGLSDRMLREIGYTTTSTIPLSQASKSYEKKWGQKRLVEFLKKQLCTISTKKWHDTICTIPWYKIYTTNFDDVLEYACNERKISIDHKLIECHRNKKAMGIDNYEKQIKELQIERKQYDKQSITTDFEPIGFQDSCIIHLNGYLRAQEIFSVQNALRLSDESYLLNEMPADWQEHFIRSLRAAKAVFFVGYSGKGDYVIQKALTTISNLKNKAFFITKEDEDLPLVDTLEDYGTVRQIGVQKFAEEILSAKATHVTIKTNEDYLSFESLSLDNTNPSKIPASTIISDLHRTGTFRNELLEQDKAGKYTLLLMRHNIESAKHDINRNTNTSVHIFRSGLGNGKTTALKLLINELLLDGIKVYKFTQETDALKREIDSICHSKEKTVIVFENFYTHGNLIKDFCVAENANVALVSTARTAVYENSLSSLNDWVRGRFHYVYDVDRIGSSNNEADRLIEIFDNNALWGDARVYGDREKEALLKKCKYQFKNIILETMHSDDIVKRYFRVLKQIETKETYYRLSLFCIVKSMLGLDLSIDETLDLFKDELRGTLAFKRDENILELIDFDNFSYRLDSSIVASRLFNSHSYLFEHAVDVLAYVIKQSDNLKKVNRKFFDLQKTLVSFGHILSSFEGVGIDRILWYYDQIRCTDFCQGNFMFWIQYSLAFIYKKDYPNAQRLINHSYQLVDKSKRYNTFQVDTIQAECWLDELVNELSNTVDLSTYVSTNVDYLLNKWADAHDRLIVKEERHSSDDISKRYRVVKRYYIPLYDYIFSIVDADRQFRINKLMKSMHNDLNSYLESFGQNDENSSLLKYLSDRLSVKQ